MACTDSLHIAHLGNLHLAGAPASENLRPPYTRAAHDKVEGLAGGPRKAYDTAGFQSDQLTKSDHSPAELRLEAHGDAFKAAQIDA
jgi:hypothetical protein